MNGLGGESLESRALLAAFTYDSVTELLTIDLDNSNEAITLTSSGGGNYIFTSTNAFTGTDTTGLTGSGTNMLTITGALALANVAITDAGSITLAADTLVLNAGIQTVGEDVTLRSINGNVTISAGVIQTQAPLDSGISSGGIFIQVTGAGNVNLLSTLSTLGASNATGPGSDGIAISITTNTGSISVGSLITDGGASSANATGGQAGAILLASGSGTPVTFNGGTISAQGGYGIGGQPSGGDIPFGAVTLANTATVVTTGPTGGGVTTSSDQNYAAPVSVTSPASIATSVVTTSGNQIYGEPDGPHDRG